MFKYIFFLNFLLLFGCQTDISNKNEVVKGNTNLKTGDGVLDLSQFSQEQQKIEREKAAKRLEELKAGRVILEADDSEKIRTTSVNLAVFARSVSNKVGEKIVGDVNFNELKDIVKAITPVPGGVGPMTIACLLKNTLECFKAHQL